MNNSIPNEAAEVDILHLLKAAIADPAPATTSTQPGTSGL
jgi:hypothetical protein